MNKLRKILLPILLFYSGFLIGQQDYVIDVQHFNTADGLSHRQVKSVFQDSQGFIWIGTKYGLNRFDGHDFKIFSKEKNGLENNEIGKVLEDDKGWLWVYSNLIDGNTFPLSFVNVHSWEVQNAAQLLGDSLPLDLKSITGIVGSPNRTIYFSIGKDIWQYQSGQFKKIYQSDKEIVLSYYSRVGKLVGYFKVTPEQVELFEFDTEMQTLDKESMSSRKDNQKKNWHIEEAKLYLRRADFPDSEKETLSQLLKNYQFEKTFTSEVFKGAPGEYWYKDQYHLFLFNLEKGVTIDFNKSYPEIADSYVVNIISDKIGNTWICTYHGVFKIRLSKNPFSNYLALSTEGYNIAEAFSSRGIALTKNRLWTNSVMNRQYIIDLKTKQAEKLPMPDIYSPNGQIKEKLILRTILKVNEQEFYTGGDYLIKYENDTPTKVYHRKKSERLKAIWSIYKGKNTLWTGGQDSGLSWVVEDSLTYFDQYNEFELLSQSTVYHFLEWTNKNVLLASTTGIYILHPQKGVVGRFWTGGEPSHRIPTDVIHHLQQDKTDKNIVWVATGGGGILKLRLSEQANNQYIIDHLEQFTIADGLSDNVTYAVYEDDFNNLWISSDYGLIQFNKTTEAAKGYTVYDGLPHNEFNRISHFRANDGQFFFGTLNGITSFYPKDLLGIKQKFDVPLRITDYRQLNGEKNQLENRTSELLKNNKIILQPNDKFLTLKFALLEYKNGHQVKYSYQIKEQSEEWIYLNDNELRLSGLPYGNFTLNVRAQGESGQFSESKLSIPIVAEAPFYQQIWFLIGVGFAVLVCVFGFFYYRTKSLLKRQRELEKTVEERTAQIQKDKEIIEHDKTIIESQAEELRSLDKMKSRFFANISHELRTPLTLILAPIAAALKENQLTNKTYTNLLIAKRNGERLHKMIGEILDLTKLEAKKLELKMIPIEWYSFLKTTLNQFDSIANSREIRLRFEYKLPENLTLEIDKKKTEVILFNLLSNAFKFTGESDMIKLITESEGEYVKLTVSDTGAGIHPEDLPHIFNRFYQTQDPDREAQGGTGIGLALTNEFVRLMGGTISAESELGKGTTITVKIPKIEIINFKVPESNGIEKIESEIEKTEMPSVVSITENHQLTILLVEDNPDLRTFIQSGLQKNYNVITAENGQVAWDLLNEKNVSRFDLIISDVMMPIMSGFQLLEKLKTSPDFRHMPVIMLTARIELRDKLKALRIGVDDYLTKPFIEEELYARIQNLIQNAENRKVAKSEIVTETPLPKLSEINQEWLEKLETITLSKIENVNLKVDELARKMEMSERQFYRQVKENAGQTPNQYIKMLRLTAARNLLEDRTHDSIKMVALSVGFKDIKYFSRQFKQAFGRLPSEYL